MIATITGQPSAMMASSPPHPRREIHRAENASPYPSVQLAKMKITRILIASAGMTALAGCTSSELYLEVEGPHIAQSVGVEATDLKFITNGDIFETASPDQTDGEQIPMEAPPHRFSLYTKGVIAVSKDRIFWAHEGVERAKPEDFLSVPFTEIEAVQRIPDNALLVRTKTQDIILRPHSWTKYAGDEDRINMLRTALMDEGVRVVFTLAEVQQVTPPPLDPERSEQERNPLGHPLNLPGELKLH